MLLLSLYKKIYNDNKYFMIQDDECIMRIFIYHYIRRHIMITNISVIHENIFVIIQDDV